MADIAPFRGLRYNKEKVQDLSRVVIPPYDVISPQEQELFHQISPFNMVRLELGKPFPTDNEQHNAHTRAAQYFEEWQRDGILIRDDRPAIYYYELDYSLPSHTRQTRCGFIGALRLEAFSSGRVRPHEKTFQAVKDERLRLMLACHANLSPIFALYADPEQRIDHCLKAARDAEPTIAFEDRDGMEHRLWKVDEERALDEVRALMQDKAIFIADGHHRYETALNYRSIQRELCRGAGPDAPFEFVMMYLSNLNQEGLTILPTHRLLRHLDSWDPEAFLKRAEAFFDISRHDMRGGQGGEEQTSWKAELESARARNETVFGCAWREARSVAILKAKWELVSSYLARQNVPEPLRHLDVVVLDRVILCELMGLSEEFLARDANIHFKHDFGEAYRHVSLGDYDVGFFVNPTRIEQVQDVASAGLIMPHKSTYFYPKVGSGLVVHSLKLETVADSSRGSAC